MKLGLKAFKCITRLLILLILLVMLFIISSFLYSAKYWPDVYNYINANITIKRIPTISELHPVVAYEIDYTTELYSTTDAMGCMEATTDYDTFHLSFDELTNDDTDIKRNKRQIPVEEMKINVETIKANYDYVFDIEITTKSFIQDLVNEDKLTTIDPKYFEIITKTDDCVKEIEDSIGKLDVHVHSEKQMKEDGDSIKSEDNINSVYPWIAAVFVMNNDNKQFEYICDGSLVSERVVLTAARCVMKSNATVDVSNILVILGKRSLQNMGPHETVLRVKSINTYENFTSAGGKVSNDLAILVLAEQVTFNEDIQPAPLGTEDKPELLVIATTGWHVTGPIQPLYLTTQTAADCLKKTGSENLLCSTLGDNESTCPSFGGLLVSRQEENQWRLQGISTGDPMTKGLCFNKDLTFTKIGNYHEWITKNVQNATS